jgi:hypothetical protein
MSTSERAFNQVKAILGKLDRSIDEARTKRTQSAQAPAPAPAAPGPGFGRAQPIRNQSLQRWTK